MTQVQITVQLPDQVESIEQLEAVIDAKGQQIKPQLFEHQLASLIQPQKPVAEAVAGPKCKKRAIFKGYQHRQLKTRFGPVFFGLPRLRCRRLALSASPAKYSATDWRLHQSPTNPSTLFAGSG